MPSSAPRTPPNDPFFDSSVLLTMDDLDIFNELSAPTFEAPKFRRREAPFDPLIFAAAIASGPQVTRHHYFHHDFVPIADSFDSFDTCSYDDCSALSEAEEQSPRKPLYVSRQKPRHERLQEEAALSSNAGYLESPVDASLSESALPVVASVDDLPAVNESSVLELPPLAPKNRRASEVPLPDSPAALKKTPETIDEEAAATAAISIPRAPDTLLTISRASPLQVQCRARTRIPTPHGPVFLHLYHNNWDAKEHLAVVVDPAQLLENGDLILGPPPIRSRSLDAQWHEGETEMERVIRGAYVGRLTAASSHSSQPASATLAPSSVPFSGLPAPLVRIHSECFTGETIGSMRCDCGEQLDEAMRLIGQPQRTSRGIIHGRGAVIYLRQEGRGIGLLEKIRAYNLQDLGHDTVSANLLLGHGADERGYEIAAAIMKDLGLGGREEGVRLLTNNPDKMEALQKEGVRIVARVPMVPRSWRCGDDQLPNRGRRHRKNKTAKQPSEKSSSTTTAVGDDDSGADSDSSDASFAEFQLRRDGATLIGGGAAHGVELENYLRTKVQRMGHMLDLPPPRLLRSSSDANTKVNLTVAHTPVIEDMKSLDSLDDVLLGQEDDGDANMAASVGSLIVSTPDLESDTGSVTHFEMVETMEVVEGTS